MKLLLLSNSSLPGQAYFEWPKEIVSNFLSGISKAAFVPYAAVSFSYDEYEAAVQKPFSAMGIDIRSVHHADNPAEEIANAECILVGGGNTFHLVSKLYELNLIEAIRSRTNEGIPYVGWSAGSNVCCPTLFTTNDMPIVQPPSFQTLDLIDWQINPHYTEKTIDGHGGESRLDRLKEYIAINDTPVLCLPEGCALKVDEQGKELISPEPVKLLKSGGEIEMIAPGRI
ncbi:MAG: dipeptidase PepE [Flavobacteriales bacterium]|jgi:dipeptidase E|nr:dipeptidase PepE [Flavobacteriales bacterium]NCG29209.1 dipeptidase PepE [Bacteroidota bacterium]MBT3964669.1 dipeptidase PepE [Flavobacteriales bacterium]MBT4704006.1 dipeptidase PepE [Flavobacteriales bacterium]MBT4930298.1 dipeptidase PepE [Flavobacteriales bacterium]